MCSIEKLDLLLVFVVSFIEIFFDFNLFMLNRLELMKVLEVG